MMEYWQKREDKDIKKSVALSTADFQFSLLIFYVIQPILLISSMFYNIFILQ